MEPVPEMLKQIHMFVVSFKPSYEEFHWVVPDELCGEPMFTAVNANN